MTSVTYSVEDEDHGGSLPWTNDNTLSIMEVVQYTAETLAVAGHVYCLSEIGVCVS